MTQLRPKHLRLSVYIFCVTRRFPPGKTLPEMFPKDLWAISDPAKLGPFTFESRENWPLKKDGIASSDQRSASFHRPTFYLYFIAYR